MLRDILKIAILCIVFGGLSIPPSFAVNSSPIIVWFGNALGSLFSALIVIYIGDRITQDRFKKRVSKTRAGRKVVVVFEEGQKNKRVEKARYLIDSHGIKIFSLFCPIFPGVLVSTVAVYALDLNKHVYKRWMPVGVVLTSGLYVFGYWWFIVR